MVENSDLRNQTNGQSKLVSRMNSVERLGASVSPNKSKILYSTSRMQSNQQTPQSKYRSTSNNKYQINVKSPLRLQSLDSNQKILQSNSTRLKVPGSLNNNN